MLSTQFRAAFAESRPALLRAAEQLTGSRTEAEELVDHVESLGHARRTQLTPGPRLAAWLRSALEDSFQRRFARATQTTPMRRPSATPTVSPETTLARRPLYDTPAVTRDPQVGRQVEAALVDLPGELRRPLALFYEGWRVEQIAERLGLTPLCVRERVSEARRLLHRRLHSHQHA